MLLRMKNFRQTQPLGGVSMPAALPPKIYDFFRKLFMTDCSECIMERLCLMVLSILFCLCAVAFMNRKIARLSDIGEVAQKYRKAFTCAMTLLCLTLCLALIFTTPTILCVKHYEKLGANPSKNVPEIVMVAEQLAQKGWILFYSSHCSACRKQAELFGSEFWRLNSVNVEYMKVDGIKYVPTWYNPRYNLTVVGYQDLEHLKIMLNETKH